MSGVFDPVVGPHAAHHFPKGTVIVGSLAALTRDWKRMKEALRHISEFGHKPGPINALTTLECKDHA